MEPELTTEFVYVFPELVLVLSVLRKDCPLTQSRAVRTLQSKGVSDVATEIATRITPPHCKNLRVVLTLQWVISVACSGASSVY